MDVRGWLLSFVFLSVMWSTGTAEVRSTPSQIRAAQCKDNETIRLTGLTSPATVSDTIFVSVESLPAGSIVSFYIDGKAIDVQDHPPFWMGGTVKNVPRGFRIEKVGYGAHSLRAAVLQSGRERCSNLIDLNVIPSNNGTFSSGLTPYDPGPSLQSSEDSRELEKQTLASSGSTLEAEIKRAIIAMYRNWGIDPFLDSNADRSAILRSLAPRNWRVPEDGHDQPWSMRFSPDAVFYHRIPAQWPRVALPAGYFQTVQLNTAYSGDGIGFGQVVADANSSSLVIRSQWYNVASTLEWIPFRMPSNWSKGLPTTVAGDRHVIFIDPQKKSFVSAYKTSVNPSSGAPNALYATGPTLFNSMGDSGGSTAANFAELPLLIQPGEITDGNRPLQHAIGGPIRRVWAARVYPASAWDAGVRTAKDSCSGRGRMDTGLIPYGGVIQLDPKLDLRTVKLSLPARRILQAMQTYGYYVMDYGCADLDIYTALDAEELEPYGGLWGSHGGIGVQNEVQKVLATSTLYVVAPLVKRR